MQSGKEIIVCAVTHNQRLGWQVAETEPAILPGDDCALRRRLPVQFDKQAQSGVCQSSHVYGMCARGTAPGGSSTTFGVTTLKTLGHCRLSVVTRLTPVSMLEPCGPNYVSERQE